MITNKKIIFIGIGFYDYELDIIKYLEAKKNTVYYLNSVRPSHIKALLSIFKITNFWKEKAQNFYTQKKIKKIPPNNDYVFVIKGEKLNKMDLHLLRDQNTNAKFILYEWDSIKRLSKTTKSLVSDFDKVLTFDMEDSQNYNMAFRPLYYRKNCLCTTKEALFLEKIYDLTFIGFAHSDRVELLIPLYRKLIKMGYKAQFKIVIRYKTVLKLLFTRKIHFSELSLFLFKYLPFKEYTDILKQSKAVIDLHHPNQSGLTMRSIESLAANCHLYTTNSNIKKYDNISSSSWSIINRELLDIKVKKNYTKTQFDTNYYSFEKFITDIFA